MQASLTSKPGQANRPTPPTGRNLHNKNEPQTTRIQKAHSRHSNLNKMKRQRSTQQVKEHEKCPPSQTKEEEIGNLPEKEFRIMIIKMIHNLEDKMELQINSLETRIEKMQEMPKLKLCPPYTQITCSPSPAPSNLHSTFSLYGFDSSTNLIKWSHTLCVTGLLLLASILQVYPCLRKWKPSSFIARILFSCVYGPHFSIHSSVAGSCGSNLLVAVSKISESLLSILSRYLPLNILLCLEKGLAPL